MTSLECLDFICYVNNKILVKYSYKTAERWSFVHHKYISNVTQLQLCSRHKLNWKTLCRNKNLLAHFYLGHNIHDQGRDCLSYLLVVSVTSRPPHQPLPLPLESLPIIRPKSPWSNESPKSKRKVFFSQSVLYYFCTFFHYGKRFSRPFIFDRYGCSSVRFMA